MQILSLASVAIALAACGSQTSTPTASDPAPARTADPASDTAPVLRSHPQAIEPAAGVQAVPSAGGGAQIVGDVNAHAPPLSQIKRELNQWMYAQLDTQLEFEATLQRELASSDDFAEGLAGFLAKRPPRFSGS